MSITHTLNPKSLILITFSFFLMTVESQRDPVAADSISAYQIESSDAMSLMNFSDEDEYYSTAGSLDDSISDIDVRRSLFWKSFHYYISYGALSADRIPCPPRSGRSYYTHNCHKARGPVRPYYRGCSAITRCRR